MLPFFARACCPAQHAQNEHFEPQDFEGVNAWSEVRGSLPGDAGEGKLGGSEGGHRHGQVVCLDGKKMICLHGRGSNSQVCELQVSYLGLKLDFDVHCLEGPITINSSGPSFAWVPDKATKEDVHKALDYVLKATRDVDIIFGFSQGAAIALAVADEHVRHDGGRRLGRDLACVCVCPAGLHILDSLGYNDDHSISVPAFVILGTHDPFKPESDAIVARIANPCVRYMDSGHGVPQSMQHDSQLRADCATWHRTLWSEQSRAAATGMDRELLETVDVHWNVSDKYSRCQWTKLGVWFDGGEATIQQVLDRGDETANAIHGVGCKVATYGELARFVRGDGSLRAWEIGPHEVVAYMTDEGPMSAVLALTVASQCSAAPLGARSTQQELASALVQLDPCMFITLECFSAKAEHVSQENRRHSLTVAIVKPTEEFAGSFKFSSFPNHASHLTMRQHADVKGIAFLLMTSGTTSKPKIVPLRRGAVVCNARATAQSLQLTDTDVCINAMPLFHIGGLSASILSTLTSGGSVLCMEGFQPEIFIQALCNGLHLPTWFSAVPTMHLSLLQYADQQRSSFHSLKHRLRFVRSGAASMTPELAQALQKMWACPILPTYSMTEQMPISQPPSDYNLSHPGSVGIPMLALVIVDACLRPLPRREGEQTIGEICISGPNVMTEYKDDVHASAQSFFVLGGDRYFRTGDLGFLNASNFLFVTGRIKDLIKVGSEQVSPFEVEEVLQAHPDVSIAVSFGIEDDLQGEITGAAVVLQAASACNRGEAPTHLRTWCESKGLAKRKIPRIYIVDEEQLPQTSVGKYRRQELPSLLKLGETTSQQWQATGATSSMMSEATVGFRFVLSIMVCFNHIGDHAWPLEIGPHTQWSQAVTSFRTMGDIGVVCFAILAGFSLTLSVDQPFARSGFLRFYESRLVPIHLIYLISSLLCAINRLCFCPPSRFQPYSYGSIESCKATPLRLSWGGTWVASLVVLAFSLQAWPIGTVVWQISYYTWFSSAYQFCIFMYPFIHHALCDKASRGGLVLVATNIAVHGLHYLTLVVMWVPYLGYFRDADDESGNYFLYAGYMFPPFWAIRFACGSLLGFTFLHFRPEQQRSAWMWGVVTDALTACICVAYVVIIVFGVEVKHRLSNKSEMESRVFCAQIPRFGTPLLCLYLYGLAVGKGFTARCLQNRYLVRRLAPLSYSIYLLHQPVFEWFSFATRGAWWSRSKNFVWFSPDPIAVSWWESLLIVVLTVLFSHVITKATNTHFMGKWLAFVRWATCRSRRANQDSVQLVAAAIEQLSGIRAGPKTLLRDCGLASLGISALVSVLGNMDASVRPSTTDMLRCETVQHVIDVVDACRSTRNSV